MDKISEKAYAKLNISLDVGASREDGYHEMCMVMQSVYFCDDITLTLRTDGAFGVSINLPYVPCDDRNIAIKAARTFFAHIGEPQLGIDMKITKRIPVCAGLGGGSSDAAAVLRALNTLTGSALSQIELEALGETLGSDVPFCVAGGTALATGRGEILTELPDFPDCSIVICKPRFSVSTPQLFSRLDSLQLRYRPDTTGLVQCIKEQNLKCAAQRIFNVFEEVLPSGLDQVNEIKSSFIENGACGAAMTGTGSAVFGVFEDMSCAKNAANEISRRYKDTFITMPHRKIEI